MDSLLYRSQILPCYSMFELSIYPLVKELCTQLNLLLYFLGYPIIYRLLFCIYFVLFRNNLSLMSKGIIIIIKDLLLNKTTPYLCH